MGSCPCDLTFRACDVRCCCDKVFTSRTYLFFTGERSILDSCISFCINQHDPFILHSNRTVPLRIWSCLFPTVSPGPLVDGSLLLQTITALRSPLKTPQIGFPFYVSTLHVKTTLTLGSFTRERKCEKVLNIVWFLYGWFIYIFLWHVFIIDRSFLIYINLKTKSKKTT